MRRIGILGGAFDPPHIGHLIIANEVRISLKLDEVWFIPSNVPPHKHPTKFAATDRVKMVELAIENEPTFRVNTIEMERKGKSFTIDTMQTLRKNYPHDEFYFIIGADMVEYLPKWYQIDELTKLVTFVGVERPGFTLHKSPYHFIHVEVPFMDISSTFIRNRLEKREPITYFVPDAVAAYIKERT